jgi:uncharacterized DUF497 family protein
MSPSFEWDEVKARVNQQKHRVAIEEAITVFTNPLAAIFPDPDHSQDEYGRSLSATPIAIVC